MAFQMVPSLEMLVHETITSESLSLDHNID